MVTFLRRPSAGGGEVLGGGCVSDVVAGVSTVVSGYFGCVVSSFFGNSYRASRVFCRRWISLAINLAILSHCDRSATSSSRFLLSVSISALIRLVSAIVVSGLDLVKVGRGHIGRDLVVGQKGSIAIEVSSVISVLYIGRFGSVPSACK